MYRKLTPYLVSKILELRLIFVIEPNETMNLSSESYFSVRKLAEQIKDE